MPKETSEIPEPTAILDSAVDKEWNYRNKGILAGEGFIPIGEVGMNVLRMLNTGNKDHQEKALGIMGKNMSLAEFSTLAAIVEPKFRQTNDQILADMDGSTLGELDKFMHNYPFIPVDALSNLSQYIGKDKPDQSMGVLIQRYGLTEVRQIAAAQGISLDELAKKVRTDLESEGSPKMAQLVAEAQDEADSARQKAEVTAIWADGEKARLAQERGKLGDQGSQPIGGLSDEDIQARLHQDTLSALTRFAATQHVDWNALDPKEQKAILAMSSTEALAALQNLNPEIVTKRAELEGLAAKQDQIRADLEARFAEEMAGLEAEHQRLLEEIDSTHDQQSAALQALREANERKMLEIKRGVLRVKFRSEVFNTCSSIQKSIWRRPDPPILAEDYRQAIIKAQEQVPSKKLGIDEVGAIEIATAKLIAAQVRAEGSEYQEIFTNDDEVYAAIIGNISQRMVDQGGKPITAENVQSLIQLAQTTDSKIQSADYQVIGNNFKLATIQLPDSSK